MPFSGRRRLKPILFVQKSDSNSPSDKKVNFLSLIMYLFLTISFCNLDNSAFNFDLRIDHGGTPIHLLQDQELTAHGTFIWNDKFVLNAGDKLITEATASGRDYDVVCTFIDQAF